MGVDEGNMSGDQHHRHQQQQYGTFQGVAAYYQPAIGFPQPIPPPGTASPPPYAATPPLYAPAPSPAYYYQHGYQAVPGYVAVAVAEGMPLRMPRLPCCGIGIGWFMFIIGFFLAAIPWYLGAIILLSTRIDYREKPGFVACTVAAVLAAIAVIFGARKGIDDW